MATLTTTRTSLSTGSAVSYADVWAGVKDIPYIGRLRVGQMEEPISLETMTRDNFTTFMEKASRLTFVPKRNTGFQVIKLRHVMIALAWSVGLFFPTTGSNIKQWRSPGYDRRSFLTTSRCHSVCGAAHVSSLV